MLTKTASSSLLAQEVRVSGSQPKSLVGSVLSKIDGIAITSRKAPAQTIRVQCGFDSGSSRCPVRGVGYLFIGACMTAMTDAMSKIHIARCISPRD